MTFSLSVAAIFKNESHIIREWVQHYILHGVEHFYLINDGSTDDYLLEIQSFIDDKTIEIISVEWDRYFGRQRDMYNALILPRLAESEWWLIVDLDEFVYSPNVMDLKYYLHQVEKTGQVQFENMFFGSNGYIDQPKSIVASFTRRKAEPSFGHTKYFLKSSYQFKSLNIHHATFVNPVEEKENFIYLNQEYYIMNHYSCQSKSFWENVKCTRTDSDNYRVRHKEDFDFYDCNDVEDLRLLEQNGGGKASAAEAALFHP